MFRVILAASQPFCSIARVFFGGRAVCVCTFGRLQVGTQLVKNFGDYGDFTGVVTAFDPETRWWRVRCGHARGVVGLRGRLLLWALAAGRWPPP